MSYCCTENWFTDKELCTLRQYQWQFDRAYDERQHTAHIRTHVNFVRNRHLFEAVKRTWEKHFL